jgi:DNA adenine methylase (dam)
MEKLEIGNRRYLGSKAKLLDFIHSVVEDECGNIHSFADVFGGTGNVANSFNTKDVAVVVNDILESNYLAYIAWFGNEEIDSNKIDSIIASYNSLTKVTSNYFSKNFSGTYFSDFNCKKIGNIRDDIETLFSSKKINTRERAILITSLLYAMDRIANTVGHYDAYRKAGNLDKDLVLKSLSIPTNKCNSKNQIFKMDANELVKQITTDIVYIDPPYNSRQYCDAYHLLENVAIWNKLPVVGVAKKMSEKNRVKSKYCTLKAPDAFTDLIDNINSKYILVSYNDTGSKGAGRSQAKISDNDILKALHKKGEVKVFEIDHNQFSTGKSDEFKDHKERLFLCIVGTGTEYQETTQINGFVKSPLNYTGGKYKLLPQLIDLFPKDIDTFVDVFGGGFNVGANICAKHTIYNDKQKEVQRLIKLFFNYQYEEILKKVVSIIEEYKLSNTTENGYEFYHCTSDSGVGSFNKKGYTKLRETYNSTNGSSDSKDFLLLVLVIFSFNNQIRFNSSGDYNMPVGKRDFNKSVKKNMIEFSMKIHQLDCSFISKDFRQIDTNNLENPFLYCDPPYLLGIASYNENDGWNDKDEKALLDFLSAESAKGHRFALSNVCEHKGKKHSLLIQWALDNRFNIIHLRSSYNNSNYHIKDKKSQTDEVLITNY